MITYCSSVRLDGYYNFHYHYGYRSQNCSSASKVVNQLSDCIFIIPAGYAARAFSTTDVENAHSILNNLDRRGVQTSSVDELSRNISNLQRLQILRKTPIGRFDG